MTGDNGASRGAAGVLSFLKTIDSDAFFTWLLIFISSPLSDFPTYFPVPFLLYMIIF